MTPKGFPTLGGQTLFFDVQFVLRFFIVFGPLWASPGLPLASLLAPFGSLWPPFWLPLPLFGLPVGALCHPLLAFQLLWGCVGLPKLLIGSGGEILARSCQDLAEILPRTCLESANNQPRTRRMNLEQVAFQIASSSKRLRSPTNAFTKSPRIKNGAAVPLATSLWPGLGGARVA